MDKRLQTGNYKSNNIIINVKETDKTYVLKFISYTDRWQDARIDMMFNKSGRCVINKNKPKHPMRVWSDKDFTIYPFQDGIPYHFELMEE